MLPLYFLFNFEESMTCFKMSLPWLHLHRLGHNVNLYFIFIFLWNTHCGCKLNYLIEYKYFLYKHLSAFFFFIFMKICWLFYMVWRFVTNNKVLTDLWVRISANNYMHCWAMRQKIWNKYVFLKPPQNDAKAWTFYTT